MHRLIAVLAVAFAGSASAAPSQYLVLATGNDTAGARAAVAAAGGTVTVDLPSIGVVGATSDSADFATRVAGSPGVLSATADPDIQWIPRGEQAQPADSVTPGTQGVNSEPFSAFQWNLRQIHADQTAAAGQLGDGAVVAVIDTGVNTAHRDLADRIDLARSKAFVNSTLTSVTGHPFEDDVFHGSHVSCIVAGSINGFGVQGVAPHANIVAVKVLDSTGSGSFTNVIRGIEYATSLGVDVINMSLGATFVRSDPVKGGSGDGQLLSALTRAVNHATSAGVLVVSAAGNEASDLNGPLFSVPAQSGNGLAVSALGPIAQQDFDRLASYSNFGASVVDLAAPGGDLVPPSGVVQDLVLSCGNRRGGNANTFFFAAGTSMATPHVAGVAALLVGKLGHVGPAQLRRQLENSAVNILPVAQQGKGRVDAAAALQ